MSAEERGKDEEILEGTSSAELSQTETVDTANAENAAAKSGATATEVQTAGTSSDDDIGEQAATEAEIDADTAAEIDAQANTAGDTEATDDAAAVEADMPADAKAESDAQANTADDTEATDDAAAVEADLPEDAAAEIDAQANSADDTEATDDAAAVEADMPEDAAADAVAIEEVATDAAAIADPAKASQEGEPAPSEPEADDTASSAVEQESAAEKPDPPKYRRGQVYSGVISKTSPTAVFVDLGDGDQGLVPGRELELMTRKMLESLAVGATVDVYVVNPRNHRGETVLSINHALEEMDWRKAQEYAKSKEVYEASIGGYNKGGLIVRFGRLRGFVPQSQLAEDRVRDMQGETPEERYGPMVNQPVGVKVMEVDRNRNRLILSERAAMREVRQRRKQSLIEELSLGEIRTGTVVSLENFGAFVDIGGAEGLVHLSELAWGHITHPRQAVNIGDEVQVEVISINPDASRIGLSRRRILRDPWDEIATSLRRGQLVQARVTKLTKFGAFARLIDNDAVEGLIHISELSGERVSHPREVVKRGDELVLRIVKIDIKERRIGLSLRSVSSTEYLDLDWEMAIQESVTLPPESAADNTTAEAETPTEE